MLERVKQCKEIDAISIATTDNPKDQVLVNYLKEKNIPYYVGSEDDVLDRYYQAAKALGATSGDSIVRMTSDCPLIDPRVADTTIRFFKGGDYDYASNNLEPYTYADGMDTEVFSFDTLERAWKEAVKPAHREHVTFYMWKNPELFKIGQYRNPVAGQAGYRLTLDYPEDLELLRTIYAELHPKNPLFTMEEILSYLDNHPEVKKVNADVVRNASWGSA
jgi:spore coat polysaccharide biosynthesis protein SpsF